MFTGSRRLSVCLLLHLRSLAGFAPTAVVYRDPGNTLEDIQRTKGAINRIWDFPQSSVSTAGLGSGITYAWDPELCANMLPTFREDLEGVSFITCNSLRAAWSRALNTWSVHHPHISFTDVTNECDAASDWKGGVVDGEGCALAQMWVTTKSNKTADDAAATAKSTYAWSTAFRHTDGREAEAALYATVGTVIGFNIEGDMCWYLDSLFCSRFHELKERFGSELVFTCGQVLLWGLWTCAVLSTIWTAWTILQRHLEVHRANDWSVVKLRHENVAEGDEEAEARATQAEMRFQMLMQQMGRISVLATTARLLMLWAPPVVYLFIFLPCWECYDFEAAAAHEVGHALGLMHPDQALAAGANLRWRGTGEGVARSAPCDDPCSTRVSA